MAQTLQAQRWNYWRISAWCVAAALLLVPLVVMQFTSEVNWGIEDFTAAAVLLGGAGLAFELAVRVMRGTTARIIAGVAIAAGLALIWAQLAGGIF